MQPIVLTLISYVNCLFAKCTALPVNLLHYVTTDHVDYDFCYAFFYTIQCFLSCSTFDVLQVVTAISWAFYRM